MEWFRWCIFLGVLLWTFSCSQRLPTCPELPVYPGATLVDYIEEQDVLRQTTYQVDAEAPDVLTYYKHYFQQHGWRPFSEQLNGFSMDYGSTSQEPPFSIGVVIDRVDHGTVTYHVTIIMSGPFAWRDWCPTLRP